jgi:hypothetical protein
MNYRKFATSFLLAATIIAFYGCGAGSSSDKKDVSLKLAPQNGTQSYLFFGEKNLKKNWSIKNLRVIDANSSETILASNEDITNVRYPYMTTKMSSYNPENRSYSNLYNESIRYVSSNKPYKISLIKDGTNTPQQMPLSSVQNIEDPSFTQVEYLGTQSYLTAKDSDTNETVLITPDMDSYDYPIAFDNKKFLTVSYPSYGSDINGYIVYDTSKKEIQNCSLEMSCTTIMAAEEYYFHGDVGNTTYSAVAVDKKAYRLNKADNTMTEIPLPESIEAPSKRGYYYMFNDDSVYFISSGMIYRINVVAGTFTPVIEYDKSSSIKSFTNDWIIYGDDMAIMAAKKDGSSTEAVVLSTTTNTKGHREPVYYGVGDHYLYVKYELDTTDGEVAYEACLFNNGSIECKNNSFWAAVTATKNGTVNYASKYQYTPYAYIRIDDTDSSGAGTMKAIDPANPLGDGLILGSMPSYNFNTFIISHQYHYFDQLMDSDGNVIIYGKNDETFEENAFLVNLRESNSLVNLTNSSIPTTDELANANEVHCHGRHCMICHNFSGGKIFQKPDAWTPAYGYSIKLEFPDGTSVMSDKGRGKGENYMFPIKSIHDVFTPVLLDANGTEVKRASTDSHTGKQNANCYTCHSVTTDPIAVE